MVASVVFCTKLGIEVNAGNSVLQNVHVSKRNFLWYSLIFFFLKKNNQGIVKRKATVTDQDDDGDDDDATATDAMDTDPPPAAEPASQVSLAC